MYGNGFKGRHRTDCGESSDMHDYLLESGYITNSLAVFYMRWYRNSISKNDWHKIIDITSNYSYYLQYERSHIRTEIEKIKRIGIK